MRTRHAVSLQFVVCLFLRDDVGIVPYKLRFIISVGADIIRPLFTIRGLPFLYICGTTRASSPTYLPLNFQERTHYPVEKELLFKEGIMSRIFKLYKARIGNCLFHFFSV